MIKLKDINITYGKKIMIDSGMAVVDSAVTVITGASGSGKSSILYLLGLISENYDFEYIFNGEKIDLTSDKTTGFYRKSKIGYVFQENTLIDSLTVQENIRLAARISDSALHLQTPGTNCEVCRPQSKKADVERPCANHLGLKFYTDYYKQSRRKKRIGKTVMLILCAFAVAFTTVANAIGDGFTQSQEQLLNKISDREIFMLNQTTPSATTLDYDENLSISPQLFGRLKNIEHVKQIYPFFEFRSAGLSADNMQPYRNAEITITKDGVEKKFTFSANTKLTTVLSFSRFTRNNPTINNRIADTG